MSVQDHVRKRGQVREGEPVRVMAVRVAPGKLTATVRVLPGFQQTTPALAALAQEEFPHLPAHACVNDRGPTFAAVMAATSVPHLLEHMVIDLQVAHEPEDSSHTFAGHTEGADRAAGEAAVTVSFRDDACALEALAYACSRLNELLLKGVEDG